MKTQYICHDLKLATVLAFAGYKLNRVVAEPDGLKTWLFQNPGDLEDLVTDYENNVQSVSDVKSLLEIFEEQFQQASNAPAAPQPATMNAMGTGVELLPLKIETQEGRDWTTKDFNTATFLVYRGNELLNAYEENGRTKFVFAYDAGLTEAVALYNQKKLRVCPHLWALAGFKTRDSMRKAKGWNGQRPEQSK